MKDFVTTLNLIKIVNMIPKKVTASDLVVGWSKNDNHHGCPTKAVLTKFVPEVK